jgi:diadenosine tetraphosphate (Ap4A) HIT family hydrolase
MTELVKKQKEWQAYLEHPETNGLMYNHPEQYGKVVLENGLCFFLQEDVGETLPGSGMIIPKEPRATVFDLTPEDFMATYDLLQKVKAHLDATLKPDGYNVGWNVLPVGGQHVPQAHLHVIPRFADERYAGRGIRYWLKQKDNFRSSKGSRE